MPQISQRFWHCSWCWCTSVSSVTSFNQISIVKNIYLDTKINLLQCKWAELHLEVREAPVASLWLGNPDFVPLAFRKLPRNKCNLPYAPKKNYDKIAQASRLISYNKKRNCWGFGQKLGSGPPLASQGGPCSLPVAGKPWLCPPGL